MYRALGYDGEAANLFKCDCGEVVKDPGPNWRVCPACEVSWEERPARLPCIPRWAYDRWGNSPPYGVVLHPYKPILKPRVFIQWKIEGHDRWQDSLDVSAFDRKYMLEVWRRETQRSDYHTPWAVHYRLVWRDKILLTATVPGSDTY